MMSKTVRPRRSVLDLPGAHTRAREKARSLPADALIFDLEDAVAPDAKEAARTNVVLAARAHDLAILDGVYNDIKDVEGFKAVCRQGLEMGFDGKTLIHPTQVEPCNEIFAPSAAELEMAGKIVVAFKTAQAEGKGVVTVDGRMIENLHVEQAERALALAAAIKELQAA